MSVFRVTDAPLQLDEVVRAVSVPEHGAIATFTGAVRALSHGKRIVRLEYEAYRPMAERKLAEIGRAIEAEWPGARVAIVHRVGDCSPSERRRWSSPPRRRIGRRRSERLLERPSIDSRSRSRSGRRKWPRTERPGLGWVRSGGYESYNVGRSTQLLVACRR